MRELVAARAGEGPQTRQGGPAGRARPTPSRVAVSSPADAHERVAHRIADAVLGRGPGGASARLPQAGLARPPRPPTLELPAGVAEVLDAPGRPLDGATRLVMEGRFGRDLSGVRVHEGGPAERSARAMWAEAFTVGQHIVFGAGRYAPATRDGRHLLAHELAHVIGQADAPTAWLDRQPAGPGVLERETVRYEATVAVDQVALRATPAGRRTGAQFHNLVASLRQDVRLVVVGNVGKWMQVRVTSGTALDGRTNQPINAAGLTGYVSAELLVRQAPPPPPVESRQTWTNKALAVAGIKDSDWQPAAGFRQNQDTFQKVYAYYSSLYLADNKLRWAAMAKLAGGEVYRGFRDRIVPAEKLGEDLAEMSRGGGITVGDVLGLGFKAYAGSLGIILLQMQKAIFMDLAWQHQAYREGGIKALAAAKARGELSDELFAAWQDIDSGVPDRVNAGNVVLLKREQRDVLQGGGTGGFYGRIQDIPDSDVIPETMSEEAKSPIPRGKPFKEVVPGGDITVFQDRWTWLLKDMIPAFQQLDEATLQALVKKSLGELADHKF
jgi:hypothetical protein